MQKGFAHDDDLCVRFEVIRCGRKIVVSLFRVLRVEYISIVVIR
jgi:hypothetical protein